MRILSNDISTGSYADCYCLPHYLPLRLMNYKDALNVSISDKLTKAKLIEISNTLQNECLANELSQPELIPFNSYIKDVRARWDIHTTEAHALIKDVVSLGRNTKQVLVNAMDRF